MNDVLNLPPLGSPNPLKGAGESRPSDGSGKRADGIGKQPSVAFRALLEKLQQKATNLERDSRAVHDAKDLSGAVDQAGDSLRDVLSLSDRLLEAYRQELLQNGGDPAKPE